MEEKVLIKSKKTKIKSVLLTIFIIIAVLFGIFVFRQAQIAVSVDREYYEGQELEEKISEDISSNIVGYVIILIPVGLIFVLINALWGIGELTVTDKRVYGKVAFGKRVDIPLDSITAVGIGAFKSVAVSSASGRIGFNNIANRDEIYDVISKLLLNRQKDNRITEITKQSSSASSNAANEIKQYKELLDSGVITQEEFDAKKKQLLNL